MSILRRLFGTAPPPPEMENPLFGHLVYLERDGCWQNEDFDLWGASEVDLLIYGGPDGPTADQETAFRRFRDAREDLLPRCLEALAGLRREMGLPDGQFTVSGLTIPALDDSRDGKLWTLWFDCAGDDHFWYGVQSDDDWDTIHPFADD